MLYRVIFIMLAWLLVPAVAAAEDSEPLAGTGKPAEVASADAKETVDVDEKDSAEQSLPKARIAPPNSSLQPVNGRIIHSVATDRVCIGGVHCPNYCKAEESNCKPDDKLTIRLKEPTHVSIIQLSAHDNIGSSRRSRLVIKVNGKKIADTLVYRNGSTLTIDVSETGELITIESEHQYNGFLRGGEEAVIWDVFVFGGDGQVAKRTGEPDA